MQNSLTGEVPFFFIYGVGHIEPTPSSRFFFPFYETSFLAAVIASNRTRLADIDPTDGIFPFQMVWKSLLPILPPFCCLT